MNSGEPWGADAAPLPARATVVTLREATATALASFSAREVEAECVRYGLAPSAGEDDKPWHSKHKYAMRRLRTLDWDDLVPLARRVVTDTEDAALTHLLLLVDAGGVAGEVRNLIFAANGPKPRIVLTDAVANTIEVVENGEHCLFFDEPIGDSGLTWRRLVTWWARVDSAAGVDERDQAASLYQRLMASLGDNEVERRFFRSYCTLYARHGFDIPALIPQVYLHYDPYARTPASRLFRQRMDFLLLLPQRRRAVLEIDGRQHYADESGRADTRRYADMVTADRELTLAGYEVYRFGGAEFQDEGFDGRLPEFFQGLLGL